MDETIDGNMPSALSTTSTFTPSTPVVPVPPSPTILLARNPFHFNNSGTGSRNNNGTLSPTSPYKPLLRRMGSIKKEPYFANLRQQLQEQVRSLDIRVESQSVLTSELQDYFRKRSEVELEYSRSLDKLSKSLLAKQKEVKQKREQINLFSINNCWSQLITETKKQSQEHGALAEIYNSYITSRFSFVIDDLQRVYKKCRDINCEAHEELLKVLQEFHTSTKTFHTYQIESKNAENKLRTVEAQKTKLESIIPKEKHEKSKKLKLIDKEIEKKSTKYTEARIKALKAKNEYLLCMDAANAAVQKYFVDDVSDLIDCMDLGFYQCITRIMNAYISTQQQLSSSIVSNIEQLNKNVSNLDSRLDKQKFLELNNSVFIMPKKLEFQGPTLKGEESPDTSEPGELSTAGHMKQELEQRLVQLHHRLNTLRTESDEMWKTLETAESTLLDMLTMANDTGSYDVKTYTNNATGTGATGSLEKQSPESMTVLKWRADRHETDEFHLEKFHDYMLSTNRIARLQAKYDHIRKILNETDDGTAAGAAQAIASGLPAILVQALHGHAGHHLPGHQQQDNSKQSLTHPDQQQPRRRKRIGQQLHSQKKPKLFGGSLEEYIECTGQEIPTIMKSCIRIINLYGLHHQGLFRVSGSQVEINHFRDAFELGEDPLLEATDASDINSIAGVFKLYLRELREPLFPIVYFEQFMELAQLESKHSLVMKMRDLVKSLPRTVFVVLRFLFAFLNHLSEFSDENMMDPYNIAICFGPTLVPVPEDKDQVQYQNLVNELIKNLIIFAEEIFPNDGHGIIYEKYLGTSHASGGSSGDKLDESEAGDDFGLGASGSSVNRGADEEELDTSDIVLSDDDEEESDASVLEAIAQYNFTARSPREISFSKGDCIRIHSQVSADWWNGSIGDGIVGLVPDKYIHIISTTHKKARDDKKNQPRTTTTSDSFLNVKSSASKDQDPCSSSSSPVFHSSGLTVQQHHKSSSTGSGQLIPSSSIASSNSSADKIKHDAPMMVRETDIDAPQYQNLIELQQMKTEKMLALSKASTSSQEQVPVEGAEQGSSSSRSHSVTVSMPKTVDNEAGPPPTNNNNHNSTPHQAQALLVIEEDDDKIAQASNTHWKSQPQRNHHHPDLVMDLPKPTPLAGSSTGSSTSSSDGDNSPTAESPNSVGMTAAECFAKQNQCTLKKNSRNPVGPTAMATKAAASAATAVSEEKPASQTSLQENPLFIKLQQQAAQEGTKPAAPVPVKKPQVKVKPVLKSSFVQSNSSLAEEKEGEEESTDNKGQIGGSSNSSSSSSSIPK